MNSNYECQPVSVRANSQAHAGTAAEMEAFDQLPQSIRFAVNYAPSMMSCPTVLAGLRKCRAKAKEKGHSEGEAQADLLVSLHEACVRIYKRSFLDPA